MYIEVGQDRRMNAAEETEEESEDKKLRGILENAFKGLQATQNLMSQHFQKMQTTQQPVSAQKTPLDQLRSAMIMLQEGLIEQEDYDAIKAKIVSNFCNFESTAGFATRVDGQSPAGSDHSEKMAATHVAEAGDASSSAYHSPGNDVEDLCSPGEDWDE